MFSLPLRQLYWCCRCFRLALASPRLRADLPALLLCSRAFYGFLYAISSSPFLEISPGHFSMLFRYCLHCFKSKFDPLTFQSLF